MAYGRGGRGRGGYYGGHAKQEEFVLFPEIELPDVKGVKVEKELVTYRNRLQSYWRSSAYFLEESASKGTQSTEIERYSDRIKRSKIVNRGPLSQYLELCPGNFPRELLPGKRMSKGSVKPKKVRWNPDSDLQMLDLFEKLEREAKDDTGGKPKEVENEEEEEDNELEEADEESSDDGDYNQNVDFDDDDDDFNMDDDGDDEPTY